MQTLEQFETLRAPEGEALISRIESDLAAGKNELHVATRFRNDFPGEIVAAAMTLIAVRARAAGKFSRAGELWLTRAGYEQASSETISRYRAARFAGFERVADLCCGVGGDLIGLAGVTRVLAVDRDPLHLACALANAEIYGIAERVTGLEADVTAIDLAGLDAVFIDPARRTDTGRLGEKQTMPPMSWVYGLVDKMPNIGAKAAPGIDHESVPAGWEREFIAEGRALKEATLWSPAMATTGRRATLLPEGLTFVAQPGDVVEVRAPSGFLLDPNPAITRAGLVQDLARTIDAWQIDEEIAFLSSDQLIVTPWARTLRVIESMPWKIREISAALRTHDIGAVDIRRRGLAGDVEAIRKQLKLKGSRRATIAMTRHRDQPWCVIGMEQLA